MSATRFFGTILISASLHDLTELKAIYPRPEFAVVCEPNSICEHCNYPMQALCPATHPWTDPQPCSPDLDPNARMQMVVSLLDAMVDVPPGSMHGDLAILAYQDAAIHHAAFYRVAAANVRLDRLRQGLEDLDSRTGWAETDPADSTGADKCPDGSSLN